MRIARPLESVAIFGSLCILACGDSTAPGAPAEPHRAFSIQVLSGDGQSAPVGTMLPKPIVLKVLDSVGKPAWGRRLDYINNSLSVVGRDGTVSIPVMLGPVAGPITLKYEPDGQGVDSAPVATVHATALARSFDHFASLVSAPTYYQTNNVPIVRGLIFSPRDTFDNVVAWPATTAVTVPNGWTMVGDTISPPAPDFVGLGAITIGASGKSTTEMIGLLDNLRARHWNVSFRCEAPGAPANEHLASGALTDSASFTGTTALVAYYGDPGFFMAGNGSQPPIQVYLQGVYTRYLHGGTTQVWNLNGPTEIGNSDFWGLVSQRPDSITFPYAANAEGASGAIAVTAHGGSPRYVGGSWCDPTLFPVRPPVVIAAY